MSVKKIKFIIYVINFGQVEYNYPLKSVALSGGNGEADFLKVNIVFFN